MLRPTLVIALVAVLGVTACGSDDDPHYVALGDSYTSAPAIGTPSRRDGCFQSINNYPHRVANAGDFRLTDASCAGATTENGAKEQRTPEGVVEAQLDELDSDTELVTVRLGANDFNLYGRVVIFCPQIAAAKKGDRPCTDTDAVAESDDFPDQGSAVNDLAALEERLVVLYEQIQKRAPRADVLAVGYQEIFPEDEPCAQFPIPAGDLPWARSINLGLNAAIARAADRAGVRFVDIFEASRGHDMCSDEPWVAGVQAEEGRGQAYHSYAEEQQLVADHVLAAIGE